MNTKAAFLTALQQLSLASSSSAADGISVSGTNEQWQLHTYPEIGLKMRLPSWKADIEDQGRRWSLLAYPLVQNPVADVQYRVMNHGEQVYRKSVPQIGSQITPPILLTGPSKSNLQTSQMTNAFWIYIGGMSGALAASLTHAAGVSKGNPHLKPKDVKPPRRKTDEARNGSAANSRFHRGAPLRMQRRHPKPLNPAAPGNGAITISFHSGRLGRAMPEPHRSAA